MSRTHKDSPQARPDRSPAAQLLMRKRRKAARRAVNVAVASLRYGTGPQIRYAAEVAA